MNVWAISGEREWEGVRGEPGIKEVGRSCREKDREDKRKKGDKKHWTKHQENNTENHTYRAEMKTNEKEKRCEYESVWGDKLSVGSSSAFSLRMFSQVSVRVSVESYKIGSSACSTCTRHVRRELSKPSETMLLAHTTSPSLGFCWGKADCDKLARGFQ